ncbi:unnamed protein product [Notodromas monacha]|uniref:Uncharacterized protein n=1 Tax=Notodromas monacha TaxID=399045 RepID=A0A7R9BYB5_9CRUS|nr:unnamed protein product [Notodromas monacha]CAG0922860.1 unnamed protein product [Notodromas monacha]
MDVFKIDSSSLQAIGPSSGSSVGKVTGVTFDASTDFGHLSFFDDAPVPTTASSSTSSSSSSSSSASSTSSSLPQPMCIVKKEEEGMDEFEADATSCLYVDTGGGGHLRAVVKKEDPFDEDVSTCGLFAAQDVVHSTPMTPEQDSSQGMYKELPPYPCQSEGISPTGSVLSSSSSSYVIYGDGSGASMGMSPTSSGFSVHQLSPSPGGKVVTMAPLTRLYAGGAQQSQQHGGITSLVTVTSAGPTTTLMSPKPSTSLGKPGAMRKELPICLIIASDSNR